MASRVADAATTELETLIAELRQRHVSDPGMASALALQDGPALLIDLGPSERAVMLDELQKAAPSLPVDDLIDSVEGLKRRKGKHSGGGGNGADDSVFEDDRGVSVPPPPSWESFPTGILPPILRRYVRNVAAAISCDESFIAIAALAVLAGCIGNRRRIRLKRSWAEPAVLWAVIIARSGMLKSPALAEVTRPLRRREARDIEAERERFDEYECQLQQWQDTTKAERGDRPQPPARAGRLLVSDVTVEALVERLATSLTGLLLYRDELAGWIRGFGQYKGGKGGDAQAWLEMQRAGSVFVDRKSGPTLSIRRAAVSVIGTVQPEVLRDALRGEHVANGLAARLLFVMPPEKPKRWTDADIDAAIGIGFEGLLEKLRNLAFEPSDEDDEARPVELPLCPDAREAFVCFYNAHAKREAEAQTDALAAAFSKLEGYAARFALIIALVRNPLAAEVDVMSIGAGIALAEWFANEAERVYAMFAETAEQREQRGLLDWISRRGGIVTERELRKGPRKYRLTGTAKAALEGLVAAGAGEWHWRGPGPSGGRPTYEFRLLGSGGETKTARDEDASNSGSTVENVGVDADIGVSGGGETTDVGFGSAAAVSEENHDEAEVEVSDTAVADDPGDAVTDDPGDDSELPLDHDPGAVIDDHPGAGSATRHPNRVTGLTCQREKAARLREMRECEPAVGGGDWGEV